MHRELILSVFLFLSGLGFITGINGTFQQTVFAGVCFLFLALPLCVRLVTWVIKAARSKKQKATA